MSGEIDLARALQALRSQLVAVVEDSDGERVRFEIPKIELELKVGVQDADEVGGDVRFKVFGIGLGAKGSSKVASETVQTLKLELKPVLYSEDGRTPAERTVFVGSVPGVSGDRNV